jgi:hypothetical protein
MPFQYMLRPKHKWYEEDYEALWSLFWDSINAIGPQNVAEINGSLRWSQQCEMDGVRLTNYLEKSM